MQKYLSSMSLSNLRLRSLLLTSNIKPLYSSIKDEFKPKILEPTTGTSQALDSITLFPKPSFCLVGKIYLQYLRFHVVTQSVLDK